MAIRKTIIVPGEYYHLCNRSNDKQDIFINERDWVRFLFLVLYFQSAENFYNLSRSVTDYVKHRVFNISVDKLNGIIKTRNVELVIFSLMPNHFHLLVQEIQKGGIARYMQRIQNAYAKYFNEKYKKTGHLFQGPYRAVRVENNGQLLHLSAYIHRNCRELRKWKNHESTYPWSSFQDYCGENRWEKLLGRDIILGQFPSPKEYKNFVDTNPAKLQPDEIDQNLLLE